MKALRLSLLFANLASLLVMLAIPFAIIFEFTQADFSSPLIIGWIIFIVPFLFSFLALIGIHFSLLYLTKKTILVASTGSFLIAFLPVFMLWKDASGNTIVIGLGVSTVFSLNFISLWKPLKQYLRT